MHGEEPGEPMDHAESETNRPLPGDEAAADSGSPGEAGAPGGFDSPPLSPESKAGAGISETASSPPAADREVPALPPVPPAPPRRKGRVQAMLQSQVRPPRSRYRRYRTFVNRHIRKVHVFLGMMVSLTLLFFGVTGFMLNHEAWFRDEPSVTRAPATALSDQDAYAAFVREQFGVGGKVVSFEGDEEWASVVLADGEKRHQAEFDFTADPPQAQCITIEQRTLPKESLVGGRAVIVPVAKDAFGIAGVVEKGGYAVEEEAFDEEGNPYSKASFTVRRPGASYSVEVNLNTGQANMSRYENSLFSFFMDLHRGTGAGEDLSLFIDFIAWALVVVGLSGFLLGTALQKRRRWPSYGLLIIGTALTVWVLIVSVT